MTSENILNDYNKKIEEQEEVCYKNNRDKTHNWESINSQQIDRHIVEVEYVCLECGNLKYIYNYLEDSEIDL